MTAQEFDRAVKHFVKSVARARTMAAEKRHTANDIRAIRRVLERIERKLWGRVSGTQEGTNP